MIPEKNKPINNWLYAALPEERDSQNPIILAHLGNVTCFGNEIERFERTNFKDCVFEFIVKGKGYLSINSHQFDLSPGSLYILHRNSNHLFYPDKKDPYQKWWLSIKGDLADSLISMYRLQNVYWMYDPKIEDFFLKFKKIVEKKGDRFFDEIAITFHEMIQRISKTARVLPQKKISNEVQIIKSYIENNFFKKIKINDLSVLVEKSAPQIYKKFKKEIGFSPYDYILNLRINHSKSLLQNTSISIKEIAYRLNFADQYYFSNLFKNKVGFSPKLYREKMLN